MDIHLGSVGGYNMGDQGDPAQVVIRKPSDEFTSVHSIRITYKGPLSRRQQIQALAAEVNQLWAKYVSRGQENST